MDHRPIKFITSLLLALFISSTALGDVIEGGGAGGSSKNTLNLWNFGATGDGTTNDDDAFTKARTAACGISGRKTLVIENGNFEVNSGNLFHLCDGLTIQCNNAIITVPATATAADTTPTDTVYDNGIFYVDNDDTLNNFTMKGCRLESSKDEIGLLQIGGTGETISSTILRNDIFLIDIEQNGGSGWIMRRTDDWYVRGKIEETVGTAIYFNANTVGEFDVNARYCGVNTALTSFANSSCLVCNNCSNTGVETSDFFWSGGSTIIARATTLDIEGFRINDSNFRHCGESCAGISVPSFAAANLTVRSSGMRGNTIDGWISQDDETTPGQSHPALSIGVDVGTGFCEDVWIDDNTVSFIGPGETWDNVGFDIGGTVENDLKDHEANAGSTEYIQIFGEDGDAHCQGFSVNNNRLSYGKRVGILIDRGAKGSVNNNNILRTGWNRNASDVPLATAHGIFINLSAEVQVNGNVITDHGPGVDGDSSTATFIIGITDSHNIGIHNNILSGYSVNVATDATAFGGIFFNGTANGLFTAIDAYDAAARVSMIASANEVENTHLNLTAVGSHYRLQDQGDMVVLTDSYVMNRTGTTTIEEGVTKVVCSSSGATITMTLPDPDYHPGQEVCFVNEDLGQCNIATAGGGAVNGDAALTTNEKNCYTANVDGDWYGTR